MAFLPASSAATCAAYGVDLREPLNPIMPADDQEIALPCVSVIVMIVLLKVAATCATPITTFFFSFLRARPAFFSGAAAGAATTSLPSFCRRLLWPDPCVCARWCGCADRGPEGSCDGASHDSSPGP